MFPADHRARIHGSLFGAAYGDGLGAPFEGREIPDVIEVMAWENSPEPLRATDDTTMMMVLAQHVAGRLAATAPHDPGLVDQDMLFEGFFHAWRAAPHVGYGAGVIGLFSDVADGVPWRVASRRAFGGAGSLGNGAAMRVAPIGLLPVGLDTVADLARQSATVTHTHPLGVDGAVAQATAVAVVISGDPTLPLSRTEVLDAVCAQITQPELIARLRTIATLPVDLVPTGIGAALGCDATALGSVPAALAAFLASPDDPIQALHRAVRIGGDTDTIAAMTGALAGARCGDMAWPSAWRRRLTVASPLNSLADALAKAAPRRRVLR